MLSLQYPLSRVQARRGNVVAFPGRDLPKRQPPSNPWHRLTADLVKAKAARGELEPAVLDALLAAVGVAP